MVVGNCFRVGLNAHLLNLSGNYRSAGINWYICHLIEALTDSGDASSLERSSGFSFTVYSGEPRAGQFCPGARLSLSRFPTRYPFVRILWEQLLQPIALRRDRIDLLHAMAFAGPLVLSIPWVVTVYDLSFVHYPRSFNALNRLYLNWAVRHSLTHASRIIAISESTRRDLCRLFGVGQERVAVVYCGRDLNFAPAHTRSAIETFRAKHSLPDRMILFVGTLEPRKNVPSLIRAFAQAKRKGRLPHRLVLVGARGWKHSEIDKTVEREGLSNDVMLAGYVPEEELVEWYRAADLFVYPSLYEGFGLPPLEAMASGTPVITSNVASLPEVVGDAALMVRPEDEDAMTEAIIRVAQDSSIRADMIARGLKQASKFSWERAARETINVYRSVLGNLTS